MRRGDRIAGSLAIALTLLVGAVFVFDAIALDEPQSPAAEAASAEPVADDDAAAVAALTIVLLPPPPATPSPQPPTPARREPAVEPPRQAIASPPIPVRTLRPLRPDLQEVVARTEPAPEIVPLRPTEPEPQPERNFAALAPSEPPPPEAQTLAPEPLPFLPVAAAPVEPRGRALLRILERGHGPSIEIAWPSRPRDRGKLFALFDRCFGMRVALMTADGVLYGLEGAPGERLDLDLDYYSGFVRSPEGRLTSEERRQIDAVHAAHRQVVGASAVRIFPRRVDAILLGGLQALIGEGYQNAATIHAAYRLRGSSVAVTEIVADGRAFPGEIDLSRARQPCA